MNILLLDKNDLDNKNTKEIKFSDERAKEIISLFNRKKNEKLRVGIINSKVGIASLKNFDDSEVTLSLNLTEDPPSPVNITLILALPRPKALKRILESVASIGIKKIFIIESWKVEKSYWTTPLLKPEEIKKHLLCGLEQSGCDTILPQVEIRKRFKPFVEDELPLIIKDKIALVAHPYNASLCPIYLDKPIVLMIGPEGGFIPYEIDMLKKIGFLPITIGKRLLKVETAVSVFLGKLIG